jgi:hypothetical protein
VLGSLGVVELSRKLKEKSKLENRIWGKLISLSFCVNGTRLLRVISNTDSDFTKLALLTKFKARTIKIETNIMRYT